MKYRSIIGASILAALFVVLNTVGIRAQSANPFVPDYAFCNVRGSIATRGASSWSCLQPGTSGQVLRTNGPGADVNWLTVTGAGTVNSVAATVPAFMTVSGSPITAAGTLGFSFNSQTANLLFSSPNGSSGAPGFRALVAADLPNAGVLTGDAASTFPALTIAANAITNAKAAQMASNTIKSNITGGTANAADNTLSAIMDIVFGNSQGGILYRGASNWSFLAAGGAGTFLQANGVANPTWNTVPATGLGSIGANTVLGNPTNAAAAPTATTDMQGWRNRFINGDFVVDTRAGTNSISVGTSNVYTVDRFYASSAGGASSATVQRTGSAALKSVTITGSASATTVTFGQRIESDNIADLAGQSVTFSANLSCSTAKTIAVTAYYANAVDNWNTATLIGTIGTFSVTTTPTRYSGTITLPANAANGLAPQFEIASLSTANCVVSQVQLEKGIFATQFEKRPISYEIKMAERYYENSGTVGEPGAFTAGDGNSVTVGPTNSASAGFNTNIQFRSRKFKSNYTLKIYDIAGNSNKVSYYISSWNNNGAVTGISGGIGGYFIAGNQATAIQYNFMWSCDAEL